VTASRRQVSGVRMIRRFRRNRYESDQRVLRVKGVLTPRERC